MPKVRRVNIRNAPTELNNLPSVCAKFTRELKMEIRVRKRGQTMQAGQNMNLGREEEKEDEKRLKR